MSPDGAALPFVSMSGDAAVETPVLGDRQRPHDLGALSFSATV